MKRADCRRARRISRPLANAMPQEPIDVASSVSSTRRTTQPEPSASCQRSCCGSGSGCAASTVSSARRRSRDRSGDPGPEGSCVDERRRRGRLSPPLARVYRRGRERQIRGLVALTLPAQRWVYASARQGGSFRKEEVLAHGDPRRHQRVRTYRPQRVPRLPRREGARVRRGERHHQRRRPWRICSSTTPSTARSPTT